MVELICLVNKLLYELACPSLTYSCVQRFLIIILASLYCNDFFLSYCMQIPSQLFYFSVFKFVF